MANLYLDGGGDPDFAQIDEFLRAHFNARAVYLDEDPCVECGHEQSEHVFYCSHDDESVCICTGANTKVAAS